MTTQSMYLRNITVCFNIKGEGDLTEPFQSILSTVLIQSHDRNSLMHVAQEKARSEQEIYEHWTSL